jgi:hypothetical protein
MQRANVGDFVLMALFGLGSPWLWVLLAGALAVAEVPVLELLSPVMPLNKVSLPLYLISYDIVAALLCAVIIALPLGYLVRQQPWRVWLQFLSLFWIALFVAALLTPEPVDLSPIYAHISVWLFLAASACFIVLGHKWRRHRVEA